MSRGHVGQRQEREIDISGHPLRLLAGHHRATSQVAVGKHHAFGSPGGAGSIDEGGDILGLDVVRLRIKLRIRIH